MGERLGQHFLRSRDTAERIVQAASLTRTDTVLEVGPGKGILTELLLQQADRVIAVEKDIKLVQFLAEKFARAENLSLLHNDILQLSEVGLPNIPERFIIVANLPYYVTSRFLRMALEGTLFAGRVGKRSVDKNHEAGSSSDSEKIASRPIRMVLMVQKEVAERMVATPPHMNLLGVSVQAYGTAEIVLRVPREQFSPPPEVDSAVVSIANISNEFFQKYNIEPKQFFEPIKKAFSQKRKMLRNSLGVAEPYATKRPQNISLEEWVDITRNHICQFPDNKKHPK